MLLLDGPRSPICLEHEVWIMWLERETGMDTTNFIPLSAWISCLYVEQVCLCSNKAGSYSITFSFSLPTSTTPFCRQFTSLMSICLWTKREMTGGVPPCPLVTHQGVVHFGIFILSTVNLARLQFCCRWLELASPAVTRYMKGTGLYLSKRVSICTDVWIPPLLHLWRRRWWSLWIWGEASQYSQVSRIPWSQNGWLKTPQPSPCLSMDQGRNWIGNSEQCHQRHTC